MFRNLLCAENIAVFKKTSRNSNQKTNQGEGVGKNCQKLLNITTKRKVYFFNYYYHIVTLQFMLGGVDTVDKMLSCYNSKREFWECMYSMH